MVWTNANVQVFHGTLEPMATNIKNNGPDPTKGRPDSDFGPGFYVTTSLHQAQQWANLKGRARPKQIPAVVIFQMNLEEIALYNTHLVFALDDVRFYDFVAFNRLLGSNHGRLPPKNAYDVVYGPLAAYPQRIVYKDCTQICFAATTNVNFAATLLAAQIVTPTTGSGFF